MSVVVLGASGFLGRHITSAFRASGDEVITVGRSGLMDVVADPTDIDHLESVFREFDPSSIINLLGAGLSDPNADARMMERVNARFPAHLAGLLSKIAPQCHLIHASSSTETRGADGSYESEYSRTKAEGTSELLSAQGALPITILRVHNTYGRDQPTQRFVTSAIDSLIAGRPIELRYPDRVRDFVHVEDVASSFVAAAGRTVDRGVTYEVGTGIGTSLDSVIRMIATIAGVDDPLITGRFVEDRHSRTIASPDLLLRPANIDLFSGLEMTVLERLRRGEGA